MLVGTVDQNHHADAGVVSCLSTSKALRNQSISQVTFLTIIINVGVFFLFSLGVYAIRYYRNRKVVDPTLDIGSADPKRLPRMKGCSCDIEALATPG